MRFHKLTSSMPAIVLLAGIAVTRPSVAAAQLPSDVRAGHWAASAVTRALKAGLLHVQSDGQFHGDAKVTRLEAILALASLGHVLEGGAWKTGGHSRPVPDSVAAVLDKTDWKTSPVRRYAFTFILVRFADYVANAVPRPVAGANVGKSEALPDVTISTPQSSPAYNALTYLARSHMIKPDSVLLKPDGTALTGRDLSHALAELAAGVNDRLTDIGKSGAGTPAGATTPKRGPN